MRKGDLMAFSYFYTAILAACILLNGCGVDSFFATSRQCNRKNLSNDKAMIAKLEPKAIRLISANIRFDFPNDKNHGFEWARRLPFITAALLKHKPDIIALQEGTIKQVNELIAACKLQKIEYGLCGLTTKNSDSGAFDEHLSILYNPQRFIKVASGHFMLSENPDVLDSTPGFGGMYTHALVWAKLRDRFTQETLGVATTHFDPSTKGGDIRVKSASLIQQKLLTIFGSTPFALMGDFNLFPDADGNEAYALLTDIGDDVRDTSKRGHFGPDATFTAFAYESKNGLHSTRLDHIFVSNLTVLAEGVINHTTTPPASDHDFVVADVMFKK